MTPEQFRESLATRRAEHVENITARNGVIADLNKQITVLDHWNAINAARIEEIDFAIESLDMASPQPAQTPAPVKEAEPRERAAWAILNVYSTGEIPDGIDDLPAQLREKWSVRSLRAGLNIAHIKRQEDSRAAVNKESDAPTERSDARSSGSELPIGGAGTPFDEAAE